jgi:hypothetical protein
VALFARLVVAGTRRRRYYDRPAPNRVKLLAQLPVLSFKP